MPFYECFVPAGILTADQKACLAQEITRIHCAATGAPESFVNVLFQTVQPGDLYTAGQPSTAVRIRGSIRAGRSPEVKTQILTEISALWTRVTGRSVEDLTVSLIDVPAASTIKGGRRVPEPGQEAEWLAAAGGAR
ncbi:MAG TPA: tautomerase family protein [Dehalococcoidia bacterium]|nr:tautomerase family protein [Dehalococcoidia bacterium]